METNETPPGPFLLFLQTTAPVWLGVVVTLALLSAHIVLPVLVDQLSESLRATL